MHTKINSCTIKGIDCVEVGVEVDISQGMPSFTIVGLGDASVQEAKERVRAAIKNSGGKFPVTRKTVNLAPADVKKHGPAFDLPIAVGMMVASGQISDVGIEENIYVGELALNGEVKPVYGILLMAIFAKESGYRRIIVPEANVDEADLVEGIDVIGIRNLREIWGGKWTTRKKRRKRFKEKGKKLLDMSSILGQEHAKRALMLAAGGKHNVLFCGPPGAGKTSLACAFQGILPEMSLEESLEVSKIYSVMGLLPEDRPLIKRRPFRSVHHSASKVSLIGGGQGVKPGEVSLAHNGVLFLDEIAEFPGHVLEHLRQPLEEGVINVARAAGAYKYPADFVFLAAMNPCPCGHYGDQKRKCECSAYQIGRYRNKLSGPLLDRIDIFVELPRLDFKVLAGEAKGQSSEEMRSEVEKARDIQAGRFGARGRCNGDMSSDEVREMCELNDDCKELLRRAQDVLGLSPRGYFRTVKLARTIADFEKCGEIGVEHVKEALQYRRMKEGVG